MHVNTLLVALTLGATCLAAPLPTPETQKSGKVLATAGWGVQKRDVPATEGKVAAMGAGWGVQKKSTESAESSDSTDGEMTAMAGWGVQKRSTESTESTDSADGEMTALAGWGVQKKSEIESTRPSLKKRTGYGIISGGNEEA